MAAGRPLFEEPWNVIEAGKLYMQSPPDWLAVSKHGIRRDGWNGCRVTAAEPTPTPGASNGRPAGRPGRSERGRWTRVERSRQLRLISPISRCSIWNDETRVPVNIPLKVDSESLGESDAGPKLGTAVCYTTSN